MNSADLLPEISENEITKTHKDIVLQINALYKKIVAHPADKESIEVWTQKINVLNATLPFLSNRKSNLEEVMKENSRYQDEWHFGWHKGWFSNTASLMNTAKKNKPKPLSFLQPNGFDVFSCLPSDILLKVLIEYQDNVIDVVNFCRTSTNRYSWFQQENNGPAALLKPLLNHAARGEWDAARKIWTRYPDLLRGKGTVSRPDGYLYENHTAFQIPFRNEEDEIIKEMMEYLTLEEQQAQFEEIFPDGELIKYDWDPEQGKWIKEDVEIPLLLLKDVYDAVIIDDEINENNMELMTVETRAAVNALKNYLDKGKSCQIGLLSDVRIFQESLKYYNENFNAFGNDHRHTFWCRLREEIAGRLSTGFLRIHCQGIWNVLENGKKLKGGGCKLADGASYWSLRGVRASHLLVGFYIDIFGSWGGRVRAERDLVEVSWKNYVEQKHRTCKTYAADIRNAPECNFRK